MNDLSGRRLHPINARIRRRKALKTARAKRSQAWVPASQNAEAGSSGMVNPDSTAQPEYAEGKSETS
jgi:hypothetical protein